MKIGRQNAGYSDIKSEIRNLGASVKILQFILDSEFNFYFIVVRICRPILTNLQLGEDPSPFINLL